MKLRRLMAALVGSVLLLGACGADGGTATAGHESHDDGGGDDHNAGGHDAEKLSFGQPGLQADADRTIEVAGTDELRFEPDAIEVKVGETISFDFVNQGKGLHEFVLGDEASMEAHQHGGSAPFATPQLRGGEEHTLTWEFTKPGKFLYECHVDDHHKKGMRGTITVSDA